MVQCFVQCVHQHTPLLEIFELSAERLADLRREYCLYQSHVAHSVYSGQSQAAAEAAVTAAEATWPERAKDTVMTSVPRYQWRTASKQQDAAEARHWQQEYLEEDVVKLQCLKQHHIHPLCPESGERVPLRGCQKQERKGVCKHEFPRTTWLCSDAKVLCPCELERHGFSDTGRRNRLGALHGPYGHEFLNPCHPAVLASMRGGNNDVQVPYRLPFACDRCGDSSTPESRRAIALGAQRAQDAPTGYCSDYCSKNQPMGYREIKEFQKGHMALHASLAEKDLQTIGKRHAARFLSDAYCKGVVRGQVECCNLRANHREGQIVAAEGISTAGFISFPGREYVALLEALERSPGRVVPPKKFIRTKPAPGVGVQHFRASVLAEAYCHRPAQSECWWLSPYEITMWWELVPTRVPYSRQEWEDSSATAWDVRLTPAGERKLRATVRDAPARLRPGAEYAIRIEATPDRILFPSIGATAGLRRNWYLQRRARPKCPQFSNCPVPKSLAENAEANARLTHVYFRAWTLNAAEESENVPFLGHLLGKRESWEESLRHWLQLLPCAETKRNVGSFLSVYRVRPHAEAEGNSDDDGADEPIALTTAQLPGALRTQLPAQRRKRNCAQNDEQGNRTEEATRQADALWPTSIPPQPPTPAQSATYEAICCAAARKAARAKPATTQHGLLPPKEQSAAVFCAPTHVKDAVRTWSAQLAETAACNPEQESFCAKVAARVLQELEDSQLEPGVPHSKPLRWVLHGGPGTGKSHTLKLVRKELFETTLGWTHGIHFQVVSFQAVMAELLEGDTIHHALGLNWAGEKEQSHLRTLLRTQETLQWRWLILDEFSMVSAELLAQLEQRCREIMRDLSLAKFRDDGAVEAFGGLNVILAGDLYQLPPSKGTFLGDVPWDWLTGQRRTKQSTGLHGQTLLWGGPAVGMQGVTELVRCERTADSWLTEVQEQLRYGALSQDNHAFLHGHGTSVPGSWTNGAPACCRSLCGALVGKSPEEIRQRECVTCRKERASRHLVACANDPRFYQDFAEATAIFATSDIKYHVNKRRAVRWAIEQKQMPHIAVARDVASATVLQDKPDLATEKLQWLQRHDQECGGLYGVLPLCIGLPVRATDHLDRQRGILKGCKGTVVGWSSARDAVVGDGVTLWNTLPEIVYVRFQTTATWHLLGLPEANVYPVPTCKRVWFLDRQKKYPQLRVWRTQFPLAPGFAITAHVAQGQTVSEGVTTDLNIGLSGNPFTAYVAFTRVPGRDKLLLFRPFHAKLFQRGVGIGRELLLRVLRGESVNWRALLDAYCEERGCCICRERKQKDAYTSRPVETQR